MNDGYRHSVCRIVGTSTDRTLVRHLTFVGGNQCHSGCIMDGTMDGRNTFNTYCLLDFLFGCGFAVGGLCGLYLLLQNSFTWPMLIFDSLFVVITAIGIIIMIAQWKLRTKGSNTKK